MARFRITGLDQMQRKLERLQKNAKALDGKHSVPFGELFTTEFLRPHSSFDSMQALLDASPFRDMKFADIPDAEWDAYVAQSTDCKSWKEMKAEAMNKWASKKLMKGMNWGS